MLKPLLSPLLKGGTVQVGADPSIAEIVAFLTAGGDAWDFSANVDPQLGVRGVLSLARGPAGLWLPGTGKIGGGYFSDYSDPGECLSGNATDLIAAVFDGGDWSVNVCHKPNLVFSSAGGNSYVGSVFTDTSTPFQLYVRTFDGLSFDVFAYASDVGDINGASLSYSITNNVWAMLTLTYTASTRTLRLYIDSVLATSGAIAGVTSTDFTSDTGPLYQIAGPANAFGAGDEAYGSTDLLLVCKGVLSQTNIDYLYNSGNGIPMSTFA